MAAMPMSLAEPGRPKTILEHEIMVDEANLDDGPGLDFEILEIVAHFFRNRTMVTPPIDRCGNSLLEQLWIRDVLDFQSGWGLIRPKPMMLNGMCGIARMIHRGLEELGQQFGVAACCVAGATKAPPADGEHGRILGSHCPIQLGCLNHLRQSADH